MKNDVVAHRIPALCVALLAAAVWLASPSHAEVVFGAVTGGGAFTAGGVFVELSDPIGTIGNNAFDDDDVRAFDELQGFTLTSNLILDTSLRRSRATYSAQARWCRATMCSSTRPR